MIVTRPDLVLKSVKSYMGEGKVFEFNQNNIRPPIFNLFFLNKCQYLQKNYLDLFLKML